MIETSYQLASTLRLAIRNKNCIVFYTCFAVILCNVRGGGPLGCRTRRNVKSPGNKTLILRAEKQ